MSRKGRGNALDAGTHEVDAPLEHEDGELELGPGVARVLPAGEHVEARAALEVVAVDDFFACYGL